jgi:hypothetical protein
MRKATRIVAALLGAFAGFGGPEHGCFEMLRGNMRPDGLFIVSMGPPCKPETVWNACEPAMTIIPSFLVTGILAFIVGTIMMIWAAVFVQRKYGGIVLILLSVALLLVGGGLFPPVIGIIAGIVGTTINKPITRQPTYLSTLLAKLWPWPLIAFFVWVSGQFVIGYFFNDWLQENGLLIPLLIIGLIILSMAVGHAKDVQEQTGY